MPVGRKGQMSLIIMVLIAVALILYAASLNWSRMTAIKTAVTISSNTGASTLVSLMASYGQSQIMGTQLDGNVKLCQYTGLFASLLTLILLVAIMVFVPGCGIASLNGSSFFSALLAGNVFAAAATAAVLTAVGIGLQVGISDPGLTKAWNKSAMAMPAVEDQYLEAGLKGALSTVQSDGVMVNDRWDLDMDGRWYNPDALTNKGIPGEEVPRFAYFYNERMKSIAPVSVASVQALRAFLQDFEDRLGIVTPGNNLMGVLEADDGDTRRYITSYGSEAVDTLGIYRGGDSKGDMFKFLWLLADTQPALASLSYSSLATTSPGCHWCSATAVGTCAPETASPLLYRPSGTVAYDQLVLPKPCTGNGCCAHVFGNRSSLPSSLDTRVIDTVADITAFRPLADTACPVDPAVDATTNFVWKKGADFGSATFADTAGKIYPVKMESGSSGTAVAACQEAGQTAAALVNGCNCSAADHKNLWRNDAFDAFAIEADYFKATFEGLLTTDAAKQKAILSSVGAWKETVLQTADTMVLWQARLARWIQLINTWQAGPYANSQSWCVPASQVGLMPIEANAILTGGPWGSLGGVIKCLEYNEGATTAFNACEVLCAGCTVATPSCPTTACNNMPRSLVTGFNANTDPGRPVCAGAVCSPASSSYLANIQESAYLSMNQVAKIAARKRYLQDMNTKAQAAKVIMQNALAYLNTAPGTLRQLVLAVDAAVKAGGLGNQVVYGWFSPRPDDWSGSRGYGYLHLVKVEAAIPNRSTGAAGFNTCTDRFPWIRTYTTGFLGSTRCYELTDTSGCVGLRVVRYDEDHDLNENGFLKFLSGLSLWRILYHNPHGNPKTAATAAQVWTNCVLPQTKPTGTIPAGEHLNEAFMLNPQKAPTRVTCVDNINSLLRLGVATETCARYYIENNKYKMAFRKCSQCCS